MSKQRQKFILKQDSKTRKVLMTIVKDILNNTIEKYDTKKLQGTHNRLRIRKGDIRIIIDIDDEGDVSIYDIDFRGNIY